MRNTFAAPDRGPGIRVMLALLVCVRFVIGRRVQKRKQDGIGAKEV